MAESEKHHIGLAVIDQYCQDFHYQTAQLQEGAVENIRRFVEANPVNVVTNRQ